MLYLQLSAAFSQLLLKGAEALLARRVKHVQLYRVVAFVGLESYLMTGASYQFSVSLSGQRHEFGEPQGDPVIAVIALHVGYAESVVAATGVRGQVEAWNVKFRGHQLVDQGEVFDCHYAAHESPLVNQDVQPLLAGAVNVNRRLRAVVAAGESADKLLSALDSVSNVGAVNVEIERPNVLVTSLGIVSP